MLEITPTKKQAEFLASDADVLLYAGGAGSGKSFVLLMDSLGLNDPAGPRIALPHYRALIVRKNSGDLSDLIDKSRKFYPLIDSGAKYYSSNQNKFWKFSSGAILKFEYFENELDSEKILGKEYQYIGLDEIGTYPNDKVFRFCMSRLRSSDGLKCYMRATSNPSRYKWLRETFKIGPLGESTEFVTDQVLSDGSVISKKFKYIQAKLDDNPHLPKEYEAQLMLLPEDQRNAYLHGLWNAYDNVTGGVYTREIKEMYDQNRVCGLPLQKGFDVYASFDLGRNDTTAIIIHQRVGKEIHIIESFEDNGHDITFYIDILKKLEYGNAHIILPHDSKMHRIETKNSVYETISQNFSKVSVVPRMSLEEGLDISRRTFPNIYIDKTKNTRLLSCLTEYHRKYNQILNVYEDVVHDEYSNMADSFRYLCCFIPPKEIKFDFNKFNTYTNF